jgi:hypothetical protein
MLIFFMDMRFLADWDGEYPKFSVAEVEAQNWISTQILSVKTT